MTQVPPPDPGQVRFWTELAAPLLNSASTPFYFFSSTPVETALQELDSAFQGLPVTHWGSVKTQPLPALLSWWLKAGRPLEVVSERELLAARKAGAAPDRILVNGPAKHHWLPRHPLPRLNVNFDSTEEAKTLADMARQYEWRCGLRLLTDSEFDPDSPEFPTQFGMAFEEAREALQTLNTKGIHPETAHLHLRTNLPDCDAYGMAGEQLLQICSSLRWQPKVLDLGGGFPAPHVYSRNGNPMDRSFSLGRMAEIYRSILKQAPPHTQLWLENGRWLLARSGVLVVRVLDVKERRGMRHLIADGGRTLNALVSLWEEHRLFTMPAREGTSVLTTVHGPTCMAFDKLARRELPRCIGAGDHIVWMEAGAYHLPWETRFSHGLASVFWHDGHETRRVRSPESFEQSWNSWEV